MTTTMTTTTEFLSETAAELTATVAAIHKAIDMAVSGSGTSREKIAAFEDLHHRSEVLEDIIASIADLQNNPS